MLWKGFKIEPTDKNKALLLVLRESTSSYKTSLENIKYVKKDMSSMLLFIKFYFREDELEVLDVSEKSKLVYKLNSIIHNIAKMLK